MMNDLSPAPFIYPPKVHPGDKVAILSPASGLPELFPEVYEQGLRRLKEIFALEPVEYPTTRKMHSSPQDRARDIHAAFIDPEIKAILTSMGGADQIKVLKYLDPKVIKAHPKAFFGYSDNTNLHNFLWNLGIVSYHGSTIMLEFGRAGAMHPYTQQSLKHALFEQGEIEIRPAPEYSDEWFDFRDPANLNQQLVLFPNTGWTWLNADKIVQGTLWGGNLEIISWSLRANNYIQPIHRYTNTIFYFETSEEMPSATEVYRILLGMGERGMLQQFSAILVGRPKAWTSSNPRTMEEKEEFTRHQVEAVMRALNEYHPGVPVIFNLDIGHTDPQCILPNGGHIRIDGVQRKIYLTY